MDRVVVGWFGPSDPDHPQHGDLWTAATIAVEKANDAGGWKGLPFHLEARWAENVWGSGVSLVARLAYEDGARAILGSVDGATTHLAEQIVAKARLPLVSPVATDESINLAGVPWMFSLVPGDHLWAPLLARDIKALIGDGRFALVSFTDHDSRLATDTLLEALAALDRGPAMRLDFEPGLTDPAGHIERLGLPGSTAVVLIAGPEDGARLLRAVREIGLSGTIFASPQLARRRALELAGEAADGLRIPLLVDPVESPERQAFSERFRRTTGLLPDWAAMHTYDATTVLLEAIRTAGLSRTAIREALAGLTDWTGISGAVSWDGTGQNSRPVTTIVTVRNRRLVVE